MESQESHDPGTSEAPTGVPPTDEAEERQDDQALEIDEQPQGTEDADAGEPEAGGAADPEGEHEEPETPDASGI